MLVADAYRSEGCGGIVAGDFTGDEAGVGEECRDLRCCRIVEQRLRWPGLHQLSAVEHSHGIAEGQRFVLVVGYEQSGDTASLQHVDHGVAGVFTKRGVKSAEWFVEDNYSRSDGECTGEGHPLLLPS